MDINNAEMADGGGGPIVRGQLSIGADADRISLGIPEHDRLLFQFRYDGLAIWPITSVGRGSNGFCRGQVAELGILLRGLTLKHINELYLVAGETRVLARGGTFCGAVISEIDSSLWPLVGYEMQIREIPEGMAMTLSAQSVLHSERPDAAANLAALGGRNIQISATIGWETLTLAGFKAAGSYWNYVKSQASLSRHDSLERSRDPGKLQDLLICQGLTSPIVPGSLTLAPWPDLSRPSHYVSPEFDDNEMHFHSEPGVQMLDNGFCQQLGSDCWITIRNFGLEWLKVGLRRENELSISVTGDGLGEVRHWGCTARKRHTIGIHGQPIKALKLRAALGGEGLQLDVAGELRDFDPYWIEHQESESSGKLEPVSTFTLHAALPWALLQLRGLPFRRGAERFALGQAD
jgi:hypothetical protein